MNKYEITWDAADIIRFDVAGGKTPVGPVSDLRVVSVEMESFSLEWSRALVHGVEISKLKAVLPSGLYIVNGKKIYIP